MASKVLITGITGFTGQHLRRTLEAKGYAVYGIAKDRSHSNDRVADLLDPSSLDRVLAEVRADYVIHLAGVSSPAHDQPDAFRLVHVEGTRNLLDGLRRRTEGVRKVILASSAYVYGQAASLPVEEGAQTAPTSPYGESKLEMERMAQAWFGRLPILLVRPFNYTGVGQPATFVVPKMIHYFKEKRPQIDLGDVSVVREFMDVRDVAQVYARLLTCDLHSEVVNLCRGVGFELTKVLDMIRQVSGYSPEVRHAAALHRAGEIRELVGSPKKLLKAIGEFRFRPLEETLAWMLSAR